MTYDAFRTGLTYRDVYYMLWTRKYKRRHTVLGFWYQIKQEMWREYLNRGAIEATPF